jgi:hypothetical protein
VQHKDSNGGVLRKNSTKRSQQQPVVQISHRVKEHHHDRKGDINEEYDDDQFERDEGHPSPAPRNGYHDDRENYQDST